MMPLLPPGSRVCVVFPSHPVRSAQKWAAGLEILREEGHYEVVLLDGWDRVHRVHAGDDTHRAAQLLQALSRPDIDAVWMGRGGSGLNRLLPLLDFNRVVADRPVLGFSDGTALFLGLYGSGRGLPVHAPVVHSLSDTAPQDRLALFDALHRGRPAPLPARRIEGGSFSAAPVIAGNLALFAATCGTPWQLDATGHVLLLEEIGEAPYRVDRMLVQLHQAGVFDGVVAVALGEFVGCQAPEGAHWSLQDILLDALAPLDVPIFVDVPVGHGRRNLPVSWGVPVQYDGVALGPPDRA